MQSCVLRFCAKSLVEPNFVHKLRGHFALTASREHGHMNQVNKDGYFYTEGNVCMIEGVESQT